MAIFSRLSATAALSAALLVGTAGGGTAAATSTQVEASRCAQASCWWSGANFSGPYSFNPHLANGCYAIGGNGVRSFAHRSQEGYFYSGNNCTGQPRAVVANSESSNMGFQAYSFLSACVSC